jgi:DNA-binding MarR family transcriptional regulator
MRDTSLLAYQQLTKLSDKQQSVLVYIHGHPDSTDKEIAEGLGWAINRVTPRRNELETKKKLIISSGKKLQTTGDKSLFVHTWRVK